MRLLVIALAVLGASPAVAGDFYFGGQFSGGNFWDTGSPSMNAEAYAPTAGLFFGHRFDAGNFFLSPEFRVKTALDWQTKYYYVDTISWPGHTTIDAMYFREDFAPSVAFLVGQQFGNLAPYVGGSLGLTRITRRVEFTPPSGPFVDELTDTNHTYSLIAGADYSLGRAFLRTEVEHRTISWDYGDRWRQFQVTVGFGVKF